MTVLQSSAFGVEAGTLDAVRAAFTHDGSSLSRWLWHVLGRFREIDGGHWQFENPERRQLKVPTALRETFGQKMIQPSDVARCVVMGMDSRRKLYRRTCDVITCIAPDHSAVMGVRLPPGVRLSAATNEGDESKSPTEMKRVDRSVASEVCSLTTALIDAALGLRRIGLNANASVDGKDLLGERT